MFIGLWAKEFGRRGDTRMNNTDKFLIWISAIWASIKVHDLAGLLFKQSQLPAGSYTVWTGSVIGSVAFQSVILLTSIGLVRNDRPRVVALRLLQGALILGIPTRLAVPLLGKQTVEIVVALSIISSVAAYVLAIKAWTESRRNTLESRLWAGLLIGLLITFPIIIVLGMQ